jgi:hypothetical protein
MNMLEALEAADLVTTFPRPARETWAGLYVSYNKDAKHSTLYCICDIDEEMHALRWSPTYDDVTCEWELVDEATIQWELAERMKRVTK